MKVNTKITITTILALLFTAVLLSVVLLGNVHTKEIIYSEEDIKRVTTKLLLQTGERIIVPTVIYESDELNAYINQEGIHVSRGLINLKLTEDEMALILGHEISHAFLYHWILSKNKVPSVLLEAEADKMAAFLILKAGYDICEGRNVFKKFEKVLGDSAIPSTHPSFGYRYDQLDMPWCVDKSYM